MTPNESIVDIDGIPLRLLRGGHGPRVLFLHGAAGLSGWLPFFDALGASHEVIATEHPGFGRSHAQSWADTIGRLADFYVGLLKRPDFGPVHLVGSSLGGWLAAEIAVRDPARLASLTLLAPAGLHVPQLPLPDMRGWTYPQLMQQLFADPLFAARVLAQPLSATEQEFRAFNRRAVERLARDGLFNPLLGAQLANLTLPTAIVWGDTDRLVPTGHASVWQQALPQAALHLAPFCGHLPHVECPGAVAEWILRQWHAAGAMAPHPSVYSAPISATSAGTADRSGTARRSARA